MAAPASKRRKLQHRNSEDHDDDDDDSFASFGEDELEENNVVDEAGVNGDPRLQQRNANPRVDPRAGAYTAGTFKSSLFKLQVDELLSQIRPRHGKKEAEAEEALHKLKKTIESIPGKEPLLVEDAERQLLMSSKVAVPFPDPRPPKDAKYKLEYARPANINVIGSYALKSTNRANKTLGIDLAITMPPSLFQEKDYLNHRYFYKRAYYLASIAAEVKDDHGRDLDFSFRNLHDDPLKPILVARPKPKHGDTGGVAHKWQINIIPCVGESVFSAAKLLPDRNCVRAPAPKDAVQQPQTPFYNSSVRSDMLMLPYLKVLHTASKTCGAYSDTCLLASSWLRQRGFGSDIHSGGFGNFEWSALMALLLRSGGPGGRPMFSEAYSSYQLFKATLQLLAVKDLSKQVLILGTHENGPPRIDGEVPVVWDAEKKHNLLYKMTPSSYKFLRQEARTTLAMLGDQSFDGFEAAFIVRADNLLYRYDYVMEFDAYLLSKTSSQQTLHALEACRKLYNTLQTGLRDRITLINILPQKSEFWEIGSTSETRAKDRKLLVGLSVNPETANRSVDHGPSAEDKEASASFRKFWGEKAELRRFKDGSILESLVWSGKEGAQSVLEQIVRYVVSRHLGSEVEESMKMFGEGFKRMLPHGGTSAGFEPMMEAFKQLETDIRNLDGLPLSIRQIMPADSQLRYASRDMSGTTKQRRPADATIQFEGSTRWPDDLVAIQRTKIAFLLKLQQLLNDSIGSLAARVGLENEEHENLNQAFLDILYDSGPAFRLRIHHDREQTLLERQLKDKTIGPKAREIAALGLAKYKRDYIKTPGHTQAIARLCGPHPALSGTIRLTKKWFASHLLSNHIADEIIELLVTRAFVQPWPWQAPSSVQTGFLRTLHWLSRWDWRAEPLIVDLSGSGAVKQPQYQAIKTTFEAWRKLDPALNRVVLFAASNVDPDGTTWSDGGPAKVVAGRMTALAKAACAEVEDKQLQLEPGSLFASPLGDFDFVLHLDPELSGSPSHRKRKVTKGVAFKNLELDLADNDSTTGFNPISDLMREIEVLYGSTILFFSAGGERPVIAGLWNPQTQARAWRLNLGYSTTPLRLSHKEEVQAELNKEAILAEIAMLGGGMVSKIEINRSLVVS